MQLIITYTSTLAPVNTNGQLYETHTSISMKVMKLYQPSRIADTWNNH